MSNGHRRTSMIVAAVLVVAAAASVSLADTAVWSATPATVQSWPTAVDVAVSYAGRNPATGTVTVQAVVDGVVITSYVPVSMFSGQTLVITVGFSGTVQSVRYVSASGSTLTTVSAIGDDLNPF